MTFIKRAVALLAALTLGTGLTLAATGAPAMAAAPVSCANSSLCGYNNQQYDTSGGYEWNPSSPGGECESIGLTNQWTSVYNNGGRTVRMYKGPNCTEGYYVIAGGGYLRNMQLYQIAWNDNIESIRFM